VANALAVQEVLRRRVTTVTDVVIVGAGFAGMTAARELGMLGHDVTVLEARDRLGGRTWTEERLGRKLEMGGTWVHWVQPFVWAEVVRYGLQVTQSPEPQRCAWLVDGERRIGTPDELWRLVSDGMTPLMADARERFPRPYEPLTADVLDIDGLTIADRLEQLNLDPERKAVQDGMWATNFNGPTEEGALTQGLRWCALAMGDWELMFEACATYRLAGGMKSLVEAIARDAGTADVRLNSPVEAIERSGAGWTAITRDGDQIDAAQVIVTTPLNALPAIEFRPALSVGKQQAAREKLASQGMKVWMRVRGRMEPMIALAPGDHPLTLVQYEYEVDGDSLLVGFGPRAGALDPNDADAVRAALRPMLPDAHVVEVTGHDWMADEFSQATWPMMRPNQLTRYLAELQRPEDGLHLAGSDYANGWAGFVDGAIESGITTARRVAAALRTETVERSTTVPAART
jgi:monoamine oxidase